MGRKKIFSVAKSGMKINNFQSLRNPPDKKNQYRYISYRQNLFHKFSIILHVSFIFHRRWNENQFWPVLSFIVSIYFSTGRFYERIIKWLFIDVRTYIFSYKRENLSQFIPWCLNKNFNEGLKMARLCDLIAILPTINKRTICEKFQFAR